MMRYGKNMHRKTVATMISKIYKEKTLVAAMSRNVDHSRAKTRPK